MVMIMSNVIYLAVDGNNIGKMLEKYILLNDFCELSSFSQKISNKVKLLVQIVKNHSGEVLLAGGDNVLAKIDAENVNSILEKINQLQENDLQFAVGLGETAINAYLALKYSKSIIAKNEIYYNGSSFDTYKIN